MNDRAFIEIPQPISDAEHAAELLEDEQTFAGHWTEELSRLRFDVKAQAVRRRIGGMLG